uniref:CSON002819 protein n=1 Tax=Culicoides sonorensis TaxID=179676 RepID=A0A336M4G1_CULSO
MDRSLLSYFAEPAEWSLFDPWRYALQSFGHHHHHASIQKLDENGFQFRVDVQQYKPEEIKVTLNENTVTVEGQHEERSDAHGTISRQFVRKFALPKGVVDVEKLQTTFSSDGVLTIHAPKLQAIENKSRVIPITRTGPVKESIKDKEQNNETK